MPTNAKRAEIARLAASWDRVLLSNKREMHVNEDELSALSALIHDCLVEFLDIGDCLKQIEAGKDASSVHDAVVDIYWKLDHIKNHILASDKGLEELMRVLASKE